MQKITNSKGFIFILPLYLMLVGIPFNAAQAQGVKGVFGMGYNGGGDTLVTVTFVGGGTESIDANKGFFFHGGVLIPNDGTGKFTTQVTLGYERDEINASNGDLSWSVIPVDVIEFYNLKSFRFGAGFSMHVNGKVKGSGVVGGLNANLDDAWGFLAQAEYRFDKSMSLGLRYTSIEYSSPSFLRDADGSGVGLVFNMAF